MNGPGEGLFASGWHVTIEGATHGPHDWPEFVEWARTGRFGPDDLVWHPQFPSWFPARDVPGLFPALSPSSSSAAAARPARRGLLVGIVCALVIVLAGAGVGTWLGLRDGGAAGGPQAGGATQGQASGSSSTTTSHAADPGAQSEGVRETLTLSGQVALPEGTALSPGSLSVLSTTGEAPCSDSGGFEVTALHDRGLRCLVLVLNGQGYPVLLSIADSSRSDMRPSVSSTARALVLYDLAFAGLPADEFASVAEALETHARLPELESAVKAALAADPVTPLEVDVHPDLYKLAAQISTDLYAPLATEQESAAAADAAETADVVTARAAASDARASAAVPAATSGLVEPIALGSGAPFAQVVDDPGHKTDEIVFINRTWVSYEVRWTNATTGASGWVFLERNKYYRVWAVDETGYVQDRQISVGDGEITTTFTRNQGLGVVNFIVDATSMVMGATGSGLEALSAPTDPGQIEAFLNGMPALASLGTDFGQLCASVHGQGFTGGMTEISWYVAEHAQEFAQLVWPFMKQQIKEKYVQWVAKQVSKKFLIGLQVAQGAYGAIDLYSQAKDFGDPARARYETGPARQVGGYYPLEATLDLTGSPQAGNELAYDFKAVAQVADDFPLPVTLDIHFGEFDPITMDVHFDSGGVATLEFPHTYVGGLPEKMWVVLNASTSPVTELAKAEFQLVSPIGPLEVLNGSWKGTQTDVASGAVSPLRMTIKIGPEGTGTADVGTGEGVAPNEWKAAFKDGILRLTRSLEVSNTQGGPAVETWDFEYTGTVDASGKLTGTGKSHWGDTWTWVAERDTK